MSVRRSKTVYERITSKEAEIVAAQQKVEQLKVQLQTLHREREELEMKKLFETMKAKGMSLEDAIKKLSSPTKK